MDRQQLIATPSILIAVLAANEGLMAVRHFRVVLACAGVALSCAFITTPAPAAQKSGDGGCVITSNAPVYEGSTQDKVIGTLNVGDCLVGIKRVVALHPDYLFAKRDGRVWVEFFPGNGDRGSVTFVRGWMAPGDLSPFTFACYCADECSPYKLSGLSLVYNLCFTDARDKKKSELAKLGGTGPRSTDAGGARAARTTDGILRNEDVLTLKKVGLDDSLIIKKIRSAQATDFDLSTNGLVSLKSGSISNAVIEVMMQQATGKH
jgi:hypothetical protein